MTPARTASESRQMRQAEVRKQRPIPPALIVIIALALIAAVGFGISRLMAPSGQPSQQSATTTSTSESSEAASTTSSSESASETSSSEASSTDSESASSSASAATTKDVNASTASASANAASAQSASSSAQSAESAAASSTEAAQPEEPVQEVAPAPEPEPAPAPVVQKPYVDTTWGGGGSVLPDSASRYYSEAELSQLTDYELFLARNEVYARHGRKFQSTELQNYFGSKSWYNGTIDPANFSDSVLTAAEFANAATMIRIEQARGSQYVQ